MVTIRKLEEGESDSPDPRDLELEQLRAEVSGLSALVRRVLSEREVTAAQTIAEREKAAPMLEPVETERERIMAAWRAEPKVQIFIAPDDNDKRAAAALVAKGLPSEFPPMVFQVNGVQLAVPKGKPTTVPESIAALYSYMLDPWSARGIVKPYTFEEAEARLGV